MTRSQVKGGLVPLGETLRKRKDHERAGVLLPGMSARRS
jgi:hypothetical protein